MFESGFNASVGLILGEPTYGEHVMRIVNRQEDNNRIMDENTLSHQNGAVLGGGNPQNMGQNNINNKTGAEDGNVNANSTAQYTIPGVLHFLQHEWTRFELERSQWDVDRAELQVSDQVFMLFFGFCSVQP